MKTKKIVLCGMFAALIAVGAFLKIDIPLPLYTMHFTMQWFFVILAGLLLNEKESMLSVTAYLLIGLSGIPVFAAGGGIGYVLRPGFGFLLGFVVAAGIISLLANRCLKKTNFCNMLVAASVGMIIYYTIGAIYFYLIKNIYVGEIVSFGIIVVQYCLITVIPDFILCMLASLLGVHIKPILLKMGAIE